MIVVLDASALAEYLLRTDRYPDVRTHIEDLSADCHVPALCDVEIASVLRRALLSGALSHERAEEALVTYADLPLTRHEHLGLLPRVLSLHRNVSAYDAVYVALCEALGGKLVTGDRRLARSVRAHTTIEVVAVV